MTQGEAVSLGVACDGAQRVNSVDAHQAGPVLVICREVSAIA